MDPPAPHGVKTVPMDFFGHLSMKVWVFSERVILGVESVLAAIDPFDVAFQKFYDTTKRAADRAAPERGAKKAG